MKTTNVVVYFVKIGSKFNKLRTFKDHTFDPTVSAVFIKGREISGQMVQVYLLPPFGI